MESGLARLGGWRCAAGTRCAATRATAAAATSPRTTTWATISSAVPVAGPDVLLGDAGPTRPTRWRWPRRASSSASAASCDLQPTDHVIEIGTGWGGFALHAAQHYGCHVTTTTISREQHALASERVAAAGLQRPRHAAAAGLPRPARPVRQAGLDRDDRGDRRAVPGRPISASSAACCKPDGLALLQAITIEDHRYAAGAAQSVDFIKRHVFPGSFIPSINAMLAAKTRASDLALIHLEDFGHSYALTLQAWRAALPGAAAAGARAGLRRALHPPVGVLSGLLRRRLPRTLDRRGAPAAGQARASRAALLPDRAALRCLHAFWANLIGYQLVWFAAVIGAGRGLALAGAAGVPRSTLRSQLALSRAVAARDLRLLGAALLCGLLLDGGLIRSRAGCSYAAPWPGRGVAPAWILALWVTFALTFNQSLRWLQTRLLARRAARRCSAARWRTWAPRAAGRR